MYKDSLNNCHCGCKCKKCKGETLVIPISFKGKQVPELETLTCTEGEENMFVLETAGETPWCNPGCCQLRVCAEGVWLWIIVDDPIYYFLDIFENRLWKSDIGMCSVVEGKKGDKVWDSLTGDIYNYTKEGWKLVGNVELNGNDNA